MCDLAIEIYIIYAIQNGISIQSTLQLNLNF